MCVCINYLIIHLLKIYFTCSCYALSGRFPNGTLSALKTPVAQKGKLVSETQLHERFREIVKISFATISSLLFFFRSQNVIMSRNIYLMFANYIYNLYICIILFNNRCYYEN